MADYTSIRGAIYVCPKTTSKTAPDHVASVVSSSMIFNLIALQVPQTINQFKHHLRPSLQEIRRLNQVIVQGSVIVIVPV